MQNWYKTQLANEKTGLLFVAKHKRGGKLISCWRPWGHATGNWWPCYARSGFFHSACNGVQSKRNARCSSRMVIIDNAIGRWLSPFSNVSARRCSRKIEKKIRIRGTHRESRCRIPRFETSRQWLTIRKIPVTTFPFSAPKMDFLR